MSEMVKREKARRVWRLNKKEGVPVLDALETVDISKDVYYRIKDKYEGKWEDEILTVEQIQKRLSELSDTLETMENRTRQVQDRLDEVRGDAQEIEDVARVHHRTLGFERRLEDIEEEMDELASRANYRRRDAPSVKKLDRRLKALESLNIGKRLHGLERGYNTVKSRSIRNSKSISTIEHEKLPKTIFDLL
jgi:chromosome segregation ATPase